MKTLAVLGPHLAIGTIVLGLFWRTLLTRKGSRSHRRSGRAYLLALIVLVPTLVPIVVVVASLDPPRVVSLVFLTLVLTTAGWTAWRSVRDRHDPDRFRGAFFRFLAAAMFFSGLLLAGMGLATGHVLTFGFSMIGIVYGGAMLGFLGRAPHDDWWLDWHLNGICLLFAATHASLVGLVARNLWPSLAGETMHATTQIGTLLFAFCLRQWLGFRHGRRRARVPRKYAPAIQ